MEHAQKKTSICAIAVMPRNRATILLPRLLSQAEALIHNSGDQPAVGWEHLGTFDKTSSIGAHKPILLGHSVQF
jgi:hypothetical protein